LLAYLCNKLLIAETRLSLRQAQQQLAALLMVTAVLVRPLAVAIWALVRFPAVLVRLLVVKPLFLMH
jgi:hypothetical protein